MSRAVEDLTGRAFGRWTVLGYVELDLEGRSVWSCRCACGAQGTVRRDALTRGISVSCGCYAKDFCSESKRAKPGHTGAMRAFNAYRGSARKRGIEFALDFDVFVAMATEPCRYCGEAPSNRSRPANRGRRRQKTLLNGDFVYSGLDRVENTVGYRDGNVVPCCKMCNVAKNDHSVEKFLAWAGRVASNLSLCHSQDLLSEAA